MYEYNSFHERKALHSLMDGLAGVDGTFASMLNLIRQLHDRWMKAAEDVRAASQLLKESLSVSIEQNEWRAKAKMRIDASESEDYSTAMSIPSCSFRGAFQSGKWIGECVWDSGAQYFGGIADGSYQGLGTWTGANGHTYTGEFVDGNRNGLGHYQFPDGQTYVGQHVANSASGYGRWTFPDGRTYTGEMRDGLFHGKGELFHPFSRGGGGTTDYGFFEKGKYIGRMPPEGKEPWNEEAASPI
jgi:hypothetical protein